MIIVAHAMSASGNEYAGLRLVVTTDKPSYGERQPIRVRLVWTNTGATEFRIPIWLGPQMGATGAGYEEGKPTRLALSILYEGNDPVPYDGPIADHFYNDGYVLKPSESREAEHRIDDTYNLTRPGRYVIRVAYAGFDDRHMPARGWRGLIIHPDVAFTVIGSDAP
jgi:hypothetical protein